MDNEIKSGADEVSRGGADGVQSGECFAGMLSLGSLEEIKPNAVYDSVAAGRVLHRSPRWVCRMCAAGRIHGIKNNGWRVFGSELVAFLQGKNAL